MMNYTNPRLEATIPDWPVDRKTRTTAKFWIEHDPRRGERACRVTTGAPKKLTFASKARIVNGDDGQTYIANLTGYGHISIFCGDMKYSHEAVFENDPRYPEIVALFNGG